MLPHLALARLGRSSPKEDIRSHLALAKLGLSSPKEDRIRKYREWDSNPHALSDNGF